MALLPILALTLAMGGCALNSTGLPGGLPVPPGGGTLTISRTALLNGIQGRTYTIWIPTSGGTGTLAAGGCTIIAGALPAGLSIAPSNDLPVTAAVSFCKVTGTITTAGPATVNFTVQAADTATPANTASQAFSIFVRPDFAVTTATPFLNGVIGRTYGNAPLAPQPVVTSASATVGNAPLTTCVFTIAGNPGFNLAPAPTAGNTCPLSSGATALTASGPFTVNLAATDSDIMDTFGGQTTKIVVPAATKNSAALALTVNAALSLLLTQATNATPNTALLNAVQGRTYGTIGGTPTYAATGGLTTTGNYNWCISVGALPAGFVTGPIAVSTNCAAPTAIATATSVTVTSPAAGAAGGPTPFSILAGDTGNAAVPGVTTATVVGAVSNEAATNLTINALLSLAVNLADPLPDAVTNRTYGAAGFTSIIYTASNGFGAYTFTPPPTAAAPAVGVFPAPMSCVAAATTLTCSSAAITGTPGAYSSAPASVDDAGNTAVPGSAAAAATVTQTRTLNVRDVLSFASINYANPLPDAVTTRTWGTGVGFTPLIYTAQNGLGGFTFAISGTAFPTGIACATAAATFTCDTTTAGSVTAAPGTFNGILVTPDDTANVTTPSASASSTQPAAASRNITVDPDISLVSVAPDPGNATTSTAVVGRTYGIAPQSPPLYTFAGGIGAYTISAPTLPAWMGCTAGANTATCFSTGVVTAGPSTIIVNVVDTANSATPAKTPPFADSRTITVNTALALAANFNNPMPDAVQGRTYGGVGFTSLVYTASNGLGGYTFTLPGNAPVPIVGLFPAPMSCLAAATTATCSSAAVTGTPGGYTTVPASVDDTANLTTPGSLASLTTATVTRDLTVRPEFSITTITPFLDGVSGRTYGFAPQSPQPVATDVSATVGNAPLTTCTFVVTAANPGFALTPAPVAATCPLSSGATTLIPAGAYNVSVTIVDSPIIDPVSNGTVVPAGSVNNTGAPLALNVNPPLAIALQVGSPDPTTAAGQAVVGRTYGAPAATDVVYDVTGGLPAYTITPSGTLAANGIICVSGATTSTCNSANLPVALPAGTPSLTISATDTGNGATPAGNASTGSLVWTVNPVISFSLAPAATGVAPNGVIPDGVVGRTYGTPLADLVFTATGGLANAAGIGLTGTQTGTLSANGIVCLPTTPQVGVTVTVTCNSGGAPVTIPSGASRTLIMTFSDVGNATTPTGSTSTDNAGFTNYSNNIADILAISLQAGSPDPTNVNAQAVVGRTYGAAPEAPVVYVATNGLPAYVFVRSGTLLANSSICGTQVVTATTLTCNSGGAGVFGTSGSLTVTVNDTGTATTPSGSAFITQTYTVNPAVTLTVTPDPALASSTAVIGRPYGIPAGLLSPTYTASNGLGLYTFGFGVPGAGITCVSGATTVVCDSAAITAVPPAAFNVTVTDGANLTTAADTAGVTLNRTFLVNPALAISTTLLTNGLVNLTYNPSGPGFTLLSNGGGIGALQWIAPGVTAVPFICPVPTGVLPPGLALAASTGVLSGIPTTPSTTAADYTFKVCVQDTANTTTPAGFALPPTPTPTDYVVNIMDQKAYIAGPGGAGTAGADTVEVVNTGNATFPSTVDPFFVKSIDLASGDGPTGVAVSPDGRFAGVTANASSKLYIIDTITDAVSSTIDLTTLVTATCTAPVGIAASVVTNVAHPHSAYIACQSSSNVAVIDTQTGAEVTVIQVGAGLGAPYGVAISPAGDAVYVTDESLNQFYVIDPSTNTVTNTRAPAGLNGPRGVAVSADGGRLFIANSAADNVLVIAPADSTTVLATLNTTAGSFPESIALDPAGTQAFVALVGSGGTPVQGFAVISNATSGVPAIGAPFTPAGAFYGVAIPPLEVPPAAGVRVFFTDLTNSTVPIYDGLTPFAATAGLTANPLSLTAGSTPRDIAHIPIPR